MKKMPLLFLVSVLSAWNVPVIAADGSPQPILPLKPAELVTYLPPAPDKWSVTASAAANNFAGGWVISFAERDFKQILPPPTPGMAVPATPATINVHITDTGYKPDFKTLFDSKKDGGPSAAFTFFKINDSPARARQVDARTPLLDILVKNRFLIEISATNLTADQLQQYAEAVDLTKLLSVPDSGDTHLSDPVILGRVDELNPKNTRSYPVFW